MMSYQSIDNWWWPYVFIAITGWLATDIWRWFGVLAGRRLRDDSILLIWVRAIATALVGAVVAKLVLYPTGELQNVAVGVRLLAIGAGFAAFLLTGKRTWVAILVALGSLIAAQLLAG